MPEDPTDQMSSEELIKRARQGLDGDASDDFQLPSFTAVRREAEAARARQAEELAEAEANARVAEVEQAAQEIETEPEQAAPEAPPQDEPADEIAAGFGSLEPESSDEDIYGPVVTTSAEPTPEPQTRSGSRLGWLRWLVAAGFLGFLLFRILDPSTAVDSLSVGDCFDDPGGTKIESVDLIDCTEPHEYEIYALVQLSGDAGEFPGDDALFDELAEVCFNRFEVYVGHEYATSVYDFSGLTPLEESWANGDREGVCLVHRFDESSIIKKSSSAAGSGI